MEDIVVPISVVAMLFVGLPWVILHYITKWKTSATLTTDDETLLEDLYQLARRLDERMDTVERLVSVDHADFRDARALADGSGAADNRFVAPDRGYGTAPDRGYSAGQRPSYVPTERTRP